MEITSTSCSPIGFGRSADRVLNTPCFGFAVSSRGWTLRTSRSARSSQVKTMIRSPGRMPSNASRTSRSIESQASGAPSCPCFGAAAVSVSGDSTLPICRSIGQGRAHRSTLPRRDRLSELKAANRVGTGHEHNADPRLPRLRFSPFSSLPRRASPTRSSSASSFPMASSPRASRARAAGTSSSGRSRPARSGVATRRPATGSVLVPPHEGRSAIGIKVERGLIFVAGGATGDAYVYDERTGADVARYDLAPEGANTFVNDVVVTQARRVLHRLAPPAALRAAARPEGRAAARRPRCGPCR